MLAMVVNDIANGLVLQGAPETIASKPAPTLDRIKGTNKVVFPKKVSPAIRGNTRQNIRTFPAENPD